MVLLTANDTPRGMMAKSLFAGGAIWIVVFAILYAIKQKGLVKARELSQRMQNDRADAWRRIEILEAHIMNLYGDVGIGDVVNVPISANTFDAMSKQVRERYDDLQEELRETVQREKDLTLECSTLALVTVELYAACFSETYISVSVDDALSLRESVKRDPRWARQHADIISEQRVRANRFNDLQVEIGVLLHALVRMAAELRMTSTVGADSMVQIANGDPIEFERFLADLRRRIVVTAVMLAAKSWDKLPSGLEQPTEATARDALDTPSMRELLTGKNAPPWGPAFFTQIAPSKFQDVDLGTEPKDNEPYRGE